jgi:chorismate mutase
MPILQEQRYDEILQKRISQAVQMGMDDEFMKTVLVAIHEESVRHQMIVMRS